MKCSVTKNNSLKFLAGLALGIILYLTTGSMAFLVPLMLGIVVYNQFLSRYFNNHKI